VSAKVLKTWEQHLAHLRQVVGRFPDHRTGDNTKYSLEDFGRAAFSVFFTQCPSFIAHQKAMQRAKGQSNAQSLFHLEAIPCDNQIRQTLDPVPPEKLFSCYDAAFESLYQTGQLERWHTLADKRLITPGWHVVRLLPEDPLRQLLSQEHKNGDKTYYHNAVTPVIVAPGHEHAIPLRPELITPQDDHPKQDCEIAAGERWLEQNPAQYTPLRVILLGDDIRQTVLHGFDFIFVCKPDSHTTLYNWVKVGAHFHTYSYGYANGVPLAEGQDALDVNRCELTVTDHNQEIIYRNAWASNLTLTDQNVATIVAVGRARWKIENENNDTLKTKGYHLEHNFGHGQKDLSSLLAAVNILAFLYHL
jgi:hypothetical protein